jgi:hypothetical protein
MHERWFVFAGGAPVEDAAVQNCRTGHHECGGMRQRDMGALHASRPAGVPAASESDVRVDPREGGGDCSLAGIAGSSNLSRPAHSADDHLPLVLHITDDDDDERVKNSVW